MALTATSYRWNLPSLGTKYDTRIRDVSSRLDSGHYVTGPLTFTLVGPRPDSETNSYAYSRNAYPGIEWRHPIRAKGGTPPHFYILAEGPNGAYICDKDGAADPYGGWVSWPNPVDSTTENFTVRIVDQDLNVLTARWAVTVGTSAFIFVQDGYSGTKSGTLAEPFEDIADFWTDEADSTYQNKIVIFRSGNYAIPKNAYSTGTVSVTNGSATVTGSGTTFLSNVVAGNAFYRNGDTEAYFVSSVDSDTQLTLTATYNGTTGSGATYTTQTGSISIGDVKPIAWVGHWGDATQPVIDYTNHQSRVLGHDAGVLNLAMQNSPGTNSLVKNSHFVIVGTAEAYNRLTFGNLAGSNLVRGDANLTNYGADNPGMISFLNPAALRDYIMMVDCTLTNHAATFTDTYAIRNWVIEGVTLSGSTATVYQGLLIKSDTQEGSIRDFFCNDEEHEGGAVDLYGQEQNFGMTNIEVCYSKLISSSLAANRRALYTELSTTLVGAHTDYYIYRNTIYGNISEIDTDHTTVYTKNVVINDNSPRIPASGTNSVITTIDNVEYASTDGAIDANGDLTGTARTTYLGTHGAEIA